MCSPIWITYVWADNDEGNVDYLVDQPTENGVPAIYDKIALVPGQRLWDHIADHITFGEPRYRRIEYTASAELARSGIGPAGGAGLTGMVTTWIPATWS